MSGVDLEKIKTGKLNEEDWPSLGAGCQKIKDIPLKIEDSGTMTINRLQAIARKEHRRKPVNLIVVDYLQLMSAKAENKRLEVGRDIKRP